MRDAHVPKNKPYTTRRKIKDQIVPDTHTKRTLKEPFLGAGSRSYNGWNFIQSNMHIISDAFLEWFTHRFPKFYAKMSMTLYHGTHISLPFPDGSEFPNGPAYFCNTDEDTKNYITSTEFWNIGSYVLNRDTLVYYIADQKRAIRDKIVSLFNENESVLKWIEGSDEIRGILDDISSDDVDCAVCYVGINGWISKSETTPEFYETMLCEPNKHLTFVSSTDSDYNHVNRMC
jgi:hypothetical protein